MQRKFFSWDEFVETYPKAEKFIADKSKDENWVMNDDVSDFEAIELYVDANEFNEFDGLHVTEIEEINEQALIISEVTLPNIDKNNLKGFLNYLNHTNTTLNKMIDNEITIPFNLHGNLRSMMADLTDLIDGLKNS